MFHVFDGFVPSDGNKQHLSNHHDYSALVFDA